jgi:NAD-dependent dihydropyrimidine dehydrogenase PreA subunit
MASHSEKTMKVEKKIDRGKVEIHEEECKGCGLCVAACPVHVMRLAEYLNSYGYHPVEYTGAGCTGCGICFYACPEPGAITVYVLESPARMVVTQGMSEALAAA